MSAKKFRPGVLWGEEAKQLLDHANENDFALPAVNVVGTNSVNAVLETAREVNSPVIIQFSNGGAVFFAGKAISNDQQKAAIAGGVSGAQHVHTLAEAYGVPVILHTDHSARKLLPWIDGLLDAGEAYFERNKKPLYSSHMIDLSEEPIEDNISTCVEYFKRMSKLGMTLEIELGVTGGEEDGVDNTGIDSSKLYTQPEEVLKAYRGADMFVLVESARSAVLNAASVARMVLTTETAVVEKPEEEEDDHGHHGHVH